MDNPPKEIALWLNWKGELVIIQPAELEELFTESEKRIFAMAPRDGVHYKGHYYSVTSSQP